VEWSFLARPRLELLGSVDQPPAHDDLRVDADLGLRRKLIPFGN
jgi:hypothetical protein